MCVTLFRHLPIFTSLHVKQAGWGGSSIKQMERLRPRQVERTYSEPHSQLQRVLLVPYFTRMEKVEGDLEVSKGSRAPARS